MPIDAKTRDGYVRYAPSFSQTQSATTVVAHPYTAEAVAKFLGFVKQGSQQPTNNFYAAFGAQELISEGYLTEPRIKGLEITKLGEVVAAVKRQQNLSFSMDCNSGLLQVAA